MITVPSNVLLARMAPGTSLCGLTFTATRMEVALASHPLGGHLPDLVHSGNVLSPERLLHLAKTKEVGGFLLGGSALYRTNGLTQFGARKCVSLVGGDPFQNVGDPNGREAMQLPIALWREPEDEVLRMLSHFLHHHMHEYIGGAPGA